MTAYVAMLRGINVGGHAKLSMANLRAAFAAMGHEDVQTYIQSGNVLFRARAPAAQTQAAIEMGLEQRFGLVTTVVLRTDSQLAAVVAHNPLTAGARNPAKLHVTFLATKPAPSRVAELDSAAFLPDELRVVGREVYLHCPDGYGRTKLHNAFFERSLQVVATTRTWNTVTTLARMMS
ncbi:MAG TPA: DUF1697 domain-containing protein [Acidimicrobiales bacterium]|nr:DUF1697 domain-containing protein [Acidimicrobiales bacterium]